MGPYQNRSIVALSLLFLLLGPVVPVQMAHASPTWTTTSAMNAARQHYTATLLPDGQVLVAGGLRAGSRAELYDPTTGIWSSATSMHVSLARGKLA